MTDPRRIWVILNPAAAGGRCAKRFAPLGERLAALGEVTVQTTEGPHDATEWARKARQAGVTDVVAVGGDGTLCEVVNGLMEAEGPAPRLGVLPLGTGNSFVKDLGFENPEQAIEAIEAGRTRAVDVVRATHKTGVMYSINLLSVGFSAEAGALTNSRFKGLGAAGYILAVLATLVRLRHPVFRVRLDEGEWDERPCVLLSFSNSRYTGGDMCMAPAADPTDGRVDVIRVGPLKRGRFLRTFPRIFQGTHVDQPDIESSTARLVQLELAEPVAVMIDGEVCMAQLERLEVVPGAIEVLS